MRVEREVTLGRAHGRWRRWGDITVGCSSESVSCSRRRRGRRGIGITVAVAWVGLVRAVVIATRGALVVIVSWSIIVPRRRWAVGVVAPVMAAGLIPIAHHGIGESPFTNRTVWREKSEGCRVRDDEKASTVLPMFAIQKERWACERRQRAIHCGKRRNHEADFESAALSHSASATQTPMTKASVLSGLRPSMSACFPSHRCCPPADRGRC